MIVVYWASPDFGAVLPICVAGVVFKLEGARYLPVLLVLKMSSLTML